MEGSGAVVVHLVIFLGQPMDVAAENFPSILNRDSKEADVLNVVSGLDGADAFGGVGNCVGFDLLVGKGFALDVDEVDDDVPVALFV